MKLPGDQNQWPQDITLNGKPVPVLEREDRPALNLVPGKHELRGHFFWERLPEFIAIPQDTGIVALKINGKSVAYPFIEDDALWLREREAGRKAREGAGDRLELQVFRRVIDDQNSDLTPIPTFPPQGGRGREFCRLGQLTVLLAPLRRSPK